MPKNRVPDGYVFKRRVTARAPRRLKWALAIIARWRHNVKYGTNYPYPTEPEAGNPSDLRILRSQRGIQQEGKMGGHVEKARRDDK